jgi:hypothetical protein
MIDPSKQTLSEVETKAIRLVTENRVHVAWVERRGRAAHGTVDGDTDTYSVSFSPAGRICTCPAGSNHQSCSHGIALELKVAAGEYLQLELLR